MALLGAQHVESRLLRGFETNMRWHANIARITLSLLIKSALEEASVVYRAAIDRVLRRGN